MKIVLDNIDIKNLIKEKYPKVKEILISAKDLEITLNVEADIRQFKSTENVVVPKGVDIIHVNEDEKQMKEASEGAMCRGGSRRNLVNVG